MVEDVSDVNAAVGSKATGKYLGKFVVGTDAHEIP